jgi:ABC-type nickel/cobalt efflux system permease component RcnA
MTLDSTETNVEVPETVSRFFESLVGVFMLLLGAYGVRRAWLRRPKAYGAIPPDTQDNSLLEAQQMEDTALEFHSYHSHTHRQETIESLELQTIDETTRTPSRLADRISSGTLAIVAGIIHGMAGPGGVLGVIPAIQLHNWRLGALYLGSFCVSSTLTMGVFATVYGTLSSRLSGQGSSRREFWIECISASLSILVGVTWLVLLSIGKLEEVFP